MDSQMVTTPLTGNETDAFWGQVCHRPQSLRAHNIGYIYETQAFLTYITELWKGNP